MKFSKGSLLAFVFLTSNSENTSFPSQAVAQKIQTNYRRSFNTTQDEALKLAEDADERYADLIRKSPLESSSLFSSSSRSLFEQQSYQFSSSAHNCLLSHGIVQCVGYNLYGQVGLDPSSTKATSNPVQLIFDSTSASPIKVVTGYDHTCTLMSDKTVWCNGSNGLGQLGDGVSNPSTTPVQVASLTDADDIEAGAYHTCAIRETTGALHCWGFNNDGQLGLTDTSGVTKMALSMSSTCVVKEASPKIVTCAGYGFGASGTDLDMGTQFVAKLTAGSTHFCALLSDSNTELTNSQAKCWGANHKGQLGIGSAEYAPRYTTASVEDVLESESSPLVGIADINAGYSSTCLVKTDGTPMCFGDNQHFQLGIANGGANVLYPTAVEAMSNVAGKAVVSIHLGEHTGHAMFDDGSVHAMGSNQVGAFGDGSKFSFYNANGAAAQMAFMETSSIPSLTPSSSPTPVPPPETLYWGTTGYFCASRGYQIKCVGDVFKGWAGKTITKEPTLLEDIYGGTWYSDYTADMVAPFRKVATATGSFVILDYDGKMFQFPKDGGGSYIPRVEQYVNSEQRFSDVISGQSGFCAVPIDGSDVICWGAGDNVPGVGESVADVLVDSKLAAQFNGDKEWCILYNDDEVRCNGLIQFEKQDVKASLGKSHTSIVDIGGDKYARWFLFSDGTVACQGGIAQCGVDATLTEMKMVPLVDVTEIKTNDFSTVVMAGGTAYWYGWAGVNFRKFGDADYSFGYNAYTPQVLTVVPAEETIVGIYQSEECAYASTASGNFYSFGYNRDFGLGDPNLSSDAIVAGVGQARLFDFGFPDPTSSPSISFAPSISSSPSQSPAPTNVVIDFPATIADAEKGKFYGINADDWFGWKTELSADGSTLIVNSAKTSDSVTNRDGTGVRYTYFRIYKKDTNDDWSLIKELKRLNGGYASARLSRDGNTIVLGEYYHKNTSLCGDTFGAAVGRVYVFELNGTTLTQKGQSIVGENCYDYLGIDIGISLDGNVLAYSTRGHWNVGGGKVFVLDFDTDSNQWVQRGSAFESIPNVDYPTSTKYDYTSMLKLSDDGSTIMVSQPQFMDSTDVNNMKYGSVRVYSWDATIQTWNKIGSDLHSDHPDGDFVNHQNRMTMNRAKNLIAVGASAYDNRVYNYELNQWENTWDNRKGKIWIYELKDGDWSLHSEIRGKGKEYFGWEIYFNAAGNVLAVGGNAGNVARIFHYENGSWNQKGGDLTGDQTFGDSISMDETGTIVAVSDKQGSNTSGVKTGWVKVYEW